ncbi:zinc metalloproteinase nas-15-like isoform X2 [Porites lutea]|uniref:zinc metalloproteinase nas-15-like isoform X1 n=1 Tax=Porites lutea TaxID=51062 RepID=UPI003CC6135E
MTRVGRRYGEVSAANSTFNAFTENRGINDSRLFEGDMILNQRQLDRTEHGMDVDSDRKRASIKVGRLWPKGVVVYQIHSSLPRNSSAMSAIRAGMNEWTNKTCIRFKRRGNETAYVNFVNGRGCYSYVGRIGRRQDITLARRCWKRGIVAHEIGHAIGFFHEQSRPDRDNFVTIEWNNILAGKRRNFRKYSRSTIDSLGTKYDYGSIMHYGSKAFSKNGRVTIKVKRSGAVIGQRRRLSTTDARQANLLYKTQCTRRTNDTSIST